MRQFFAELEIETSGSGLHDITGDLARWVSDQQMSDGLLTAFIRHTSASLTVQENADPDVLRDLGDFLSRIVPRDTSLYRHTTEGPDDMPAHIRSALTLTQLSIPVHGGRLLLGTWQAIYLFEHRDGDFSRSVALHLLGD